ncbi:MAG: hypothetical protein HFJ72_09135 [Adlercreutzia sp.]|uniref:zinc ribbon domain-containing protein n=1 Tax=uncultured Adlercreutzia sp. TaxID=875803 RepID=UPI0021745694|nr:hypothetical protein [uncultured Adlercreutzia sp.]MCI8425799.1 hypothetical protein [Adlercreutzia sp.]
MFCYSCGKEINDSAVFCRFCGNRVSHVAPQAGGNAQNDGVSQDAPVSPAFSASQSAPNGFAGQGSQAPQASVGASAPSSPSIPLPHISPEAFANGQQVKEALKSTTPSDRRINIIFGAGSALLVLFTFLPWLKGGLLTVNPYVFAKTFIENGLNYGALNFTMVGVAVALAVAIIVLASAYSAYLNFAKGRTFNLGNAASFVACLLFMITCLVHQFAAQSSDGGMSLPISMSFEIGFYLTIVVSLVLTILGSGRIDLQKYLNGIGASQK